MATDLLPVPAATLEFARTLATALPDTYRLLPIYKIGATHRGWMVRDQYHEDLARLTRTGVRRAARRMAAHIRLSQWQVFGRFPDRVPGCETYNMTNRRRGVALQAIRYWAASDRPVTRFRTAGG